MQLRKRNRLVYAANRAVEHLLYLKRDDAALQRRILEDGRRSGPGKQLPIDEVGALSPEEFSATLDTIAAGKIDVAKLITDEVGLDDVPNAFDMLAHPDDHVKIIVTPNAR